MIGLRVIGVGVIGMSSPAPDGRGRTVLLSLAVVLAVIVVALAGMLVFRANSAPKPRSGPSPSTTPSPTTTTSDRESETSTQAPVPPPTKKQAEPGSVTYQLTGDGDVVALAYRDISGRVLIAATGTPWSKRTTVSDRDVEMTAVVLRGPVTCTVLQGEKLISSSTSRGGPLRCAGRLPH